MPAILESSLKCEVVQLAKAFCKKAFFKTGTGIGLWISTSSFSSSPQKKVLLYHRPVWPWPSQAQLVPTRYWGRCLRISISQNKLWYYKNLTNWNNSASYQLIIYTLAIWIDIPCSSPGPSISCIVKSALMGTSRLEGMQLPNRHLFFPQLLPLLRVAATQDGRMA